MELYNYPGWVAILQALMTGEKDKKRDLETQEARTFSNIEWLNDPQATRQRPLKYSQSKKYFPNPLASLYASVFRWELSWHYLNNVLVVLLKYVLKNDRC